MNDPHYRAINYPYHIPERSYIMHNGTCTMVDHDDTLSDLGGRTPVLALGSNMSPQQLARKFPGPDGAPIPVTKIKLKHFDSVYATHFSGYGAIPATLLPSPGTEVSLFINWLDDAQMQSMHKTEIPGENYQYCRLNNIEATLANGPELDHVFVYLSSRGALSIDGEPVPLAAVPALHRRWSAMHQHEIQEHARSTMAPDMALRDFIHQTIDCTQSRRTRTDTLHGGVIAFEHDDMDVIRT